MAKKVSKERNKLIKTSVIFWIVVFMLYATIFGPFIKDMASWRLWLKIVLLVLVILLPLTGQGLIIYTQLNKNKNQKALK